jgi:methylene-fatty-acyl-phospholipid synthase
MRVELLLAAAALLGLERACYIWIARAPDAFRRASEAPGVAWLGGPVAAVAVLFGAFKIVQASVFLGWCYAHGAGRLFPVGAPTAALVLGGALAGAGQVLSVAVFYRLGRIGVFFGDRFGYPVPWCRAFPFTWFSHPQYVGTVLTIWGLFLVMRYPHADWYALPALETAYYTLGARLEAGRRPAGAGCAPVPGASVDGSCRADGTQG